jgi:isoquinoline 1-oxidoreductase subunit beta
MSLEISRRSFIAVLGGAVGGLALGVRFGGEGNEALAETLPASGFSPNVFVHIAPDGVVSIVCHRSEMGQGIRSSLPVVVADEMGADWARVRVVQGDGDKRYGNQNTDGSRSVRDFFPGMRTAGATARAMLITAAAQRWQVPEAGLTAHDHAVHDAGGRSLGFGELAAAAAALSVPAAESVKLLPLGELRRVGKELPLIDGPAYVTGTAVYGADVRLPGMLIAVIARPPVVGGKVARVDDAAALKVPGVRRVVKMPEWTAPAGFQPLGGVAVLADHTWAALRGRAALSIDWENGANEVYDSTAYKAALEAAVRAPGQAVRTVGDADGALAAADRVITAEYHVPHLVHAPMEPPAAVARVSAEGCEVWAATQNPQSAQTEVARALGIDASKVIVHVTFLGGGFGRKSKPDYASEAALLAREAGAPVRVQWTRDDDIRHGYYHAVSTQRLEAGLDAAGKITAWRHRIASPSIGSTFNNGVDRISAGELGQGVTDLPLAIPAVRVETCEARAHVRIGWLRSVYNINHAFAVQSFIAELAAATRRDPREVLLEVIGPARLLTTTEAGVDKIPNYGAALDEHPVDVGRLRRVIERVTENAGWDAARQAGKAVGLAAHRSFLTYTAAVAAVSRDARGLVQVDEVWIAADAGTVINPDRVRSQLEGAVVFGISAALHGAITMRRGAVEQTNFRDYPLARIGETPRQIHIEILPSTAPPGGVGEPGLPPVAPAIANAVFALTGRRVRELPLRRAGV